MREDINSKAKLQFAGHESCQVSDLLNMKFSCSLDSCNYQVVVGELFVTPKNRNKHSRFSAAWPSVSQNNSKLLERSQPSLSPWTSCLQSLPNRGSHFGMTSCPALTTYWSMIFKFLSKHCSLAGEFYYTGNQNTPLNCLCGLATWCSSYS